MRETRITIPELILVAGTRALLGAGVGLVLADRLSLDQRRAVGWMLLLVGAFSTIPLAFEVLGQRSGGPAESATSGLRSVADRQLQEVYPHI